MNSSYLARLQGLKLGTIKPDGPKPKKPMRTVSEKKKQQNKEQSKIKGPENFRKALTEWFDKIAAKEVYIHPVTKSEGCDCKECGAWIPAGLIRTAIAHLLPKNRFKSVAMNDLNYLILGAGCGCHYKTDRLDKFTTMKVWPQAAERINKLLPLLPYEELKYVSAQLYEALENT